MEFRRADKRRSRNVRPRGKVATPGSNARACTHVRSGGLSGMCRDYAGGVPQLYGCCKASVQAPASSAVACAQSNPIRNVVKQSRGRRADRSERFESDSWEHYAAFQSGVLRSFPGFGGNSSSSRTRAGFEIFQIFQDWNISVEIFDFETFLNISNISGNI